MIYRFFVYKYAEWSTDRQNIGTGQKETTSPQGRSEADCRTPTYKEDGRSGENYMKSLDAGRFQQVTVEILGEGLLSACGLLVADIDYETGKTMQSSQSDHSSISDFYAGRSVFITGATGVLGKAFVEKLAYYCTQIDNIYILVRKKENVNQEQRMQKYFDDPIFFRLKQKRREALSKIIPIFGDISLSSLGLNAEDEHTLISKVSVIIHSAASTKFNQLLKDAIRVNVEGTRNVLELAKRMENACVFVYISTAYSHIHENPLRETVYPPPVSLEEAERFAIEHFVRGDDDKEITKFLKGYPNTYNFSKALAEHVVDKERGQLPTIIIRPSIIAAAERDPVEGWIDTWGGCTSLVIFVGKGWNHVMLSAKDIILDIIPLDYVVNLTIVAAARIRKKPGMTVCHSCSSSTNPITMQEIVNFIQEYKINHNISDSLFNVKFMLSKHKLCVSMVTCLMQTTPAVLADMWLRCRGMSTRYMAQQSKVVKVRNVLNYFTTRSWTFHGEAATSLFSSLNPEDQQALPCDPTAIDWREYFILYQNGIQEYLLKNI